MAGHTEGPWWAQGRAVKAEVGGREITVAGAKLYIEPDPGSAASTFADQEQAEANARLIAAAPDLLAAFKEAVAIYQAEFGFGFDTPKEELDANASRWLAIIAEAEGGD